MTLKTTALLAMMAQAGIPVPAEAASFPVFTAFLADIGDAQSIEAELSTFSAHIVNLDRLSRLADAHSLVLLDELGSATDPEEGSALAVAVAGSFSTAGAWSLISTHHTSLKVYAANTPGVLNAAAGVDEVTLVPNYHLRLGVPGASAGIQTAERLGPAMRSSLPARASGLARSRWTLRGSSTSCTTNLAPLEVEQKEAREAAIRAEPGAGKAGARRRCGTAQSHARTRRPSWLRCSRISNFRCARMCAPSRTAPRSRSSQKKPSGASTGCAANFRRALIRLSLRTARGADQGDANAQPHVLKHIAPGDQVRLKSMNKIAAVQREVEKDVFEVALGPIKMRVKRDECSATVSSWRRFRAGEKADPLAAARTAEERARFCDQRQHRRHAHGDQPDWAHGG